MPMGSCVGHQKSYDMVVFTEECQIPKPPSHTTTLQDPLDITTETTTVQEDEISKQMILDLTKHPRYTPAGQALLPAGTDRMTALHMRKYRHGLAILMIAM